MKNLLLILLTIPFLSFGQLLDVSSVINAFNDLDSFKKEITESLDIDTIIYNQKVNFDGYNYTVYVVNNKGMSGILVSNEAISIAMEGDVYIKYYDEFYNYLNEHCFVTMRNDDNNCTYDDWECEYCFWNIKFYEDSVGGLFYIRSKNGLD